MGTKNKPGAYDCYAAAEPDEPMFILLARDPSAPGLVRAWAEKRRRRHGAMEKDRQKAAEADECARAMDLWRQQKTKKGATND